jgi:chemotaxis protein CheC
MMQSTPLLTKEELSVWSWLVSKGISNAMQGLSSMIGAELVVTSLRLEQCSVQQAADLLGGPENIVLGIYLSVEGDATGHLMLVHDPRMAYNLIDMQMGLPSGTTQQLDEMERSIMGEMGNITGSFFLNALADATEMTLSITPPAVMVDMAGAILGIALADIMREQDEVLVVRTTFGTANQQVDGNFLVMPTMEFLRAILKRTPCGAKPW